MKKVCLFVIGLSFLCLIMVGGNAFAVDEEFAELEKDLIDGVLTVKSEDPKNNPLIAFALNGIFETKYGLSMIPDCDYSQCITTHPGQTRVVLNSETDFYHVKFIKYDSTWHGATWWNNEDNQLEWNIADSGIVTEKKVLVKYTGVDQSKKTKVLDSISDIVQKHGWDRTNSSWRNEGWLKYSYYNVEDLSFVNYMITTNYSPYDSGSYSIGLGRMVNYSLDFRKDLANKNIQVVSYASGGCDGGAFSNFLQSTVVIMSDGYVFDAMSSVNTAVARVIYIPENTDDNPEAFIKAAQKRIDNYYKDTEYEDKIKISYGYPILSDSPYGIDTFDYVEIDGVSWPIHNGKKINITDSYDIEYNGKKMDLAIIKDDDMLEEPSLITSDLDTDITVLSNDATIPLDTIVVVNKINKKDRSGTIERLGLKDADIYDINLRSDATNRDITKLSNGKFLVRIPVDQKYEGRKLAVYYIDVNGKVETHEVTIKDGYAEFETNHFSEYILGTTEDAQTNPGTLDTICAVLAVAAGCAVVFLSNLKIAAKRR